MRVDARGLFLVEPQTSSNIDFRFTIYPQLIR